MKFVWRDSPPHYRCTIAPAVKIKMKQFGGIEAFVGKITDMGYVIQRDGRFMAYVYGSVNPDTPGQFFNKIEDAKAYVEEQALIGLTLKKLEGNV
jgi:ribosomal protein S16